MAPGSFISINLPTFVSQHLFPTRLGMTGGFISGYPYGPINMYQYILYMFKSQRKAISNLSNKMALLKNKQEMKGKIRKYSLRLRHTSCDPSLTPPTKPLGNFPSFLQMEDLLHLPREM